ncbi:FAD dependent oxidoreductase [Scheffersomyces xylosifermentans]|uniref:FAD dependent oxidoreductase n=1 Tax=Scheffersomyces xylosifermentans TaxID=1304137 RepID=UPI00315DC0A1
MSMVEVDSPIVIVGAGTFGLSTALELLRSGYTDITLVDPYPVPSPLSAGNDVNKIFQSIVDNEFLSKLALESFDLWRNDPVYREAFHETGIIYAATGKEKQMDIHERKKSLKLQNIPFTELNDSISFSRALPSLADKNSSFLFKNWIGYHQETKCGWIFARQALETASAEIKKLGGKFIREEVSQLVYEEPLSELKCVIGIQTASGRAIKASRVVICAGAQSYKFLDFENQLLAKCFTLAHISLNKQEMGILKGMPVLLNLDEGFFFEPDMEGGLKICNEFPGYINIIDKEKDSVPLYVNKIPREADKQIRSFLKQCIPELSNREFDSVKICWCTDTPDRNFLIGTHPTINNVILGTGDSGQGFKYMPVIGKYIKDMVVDGGKSISPSVKELWRWRPETGKSRNVYDVQNRYGGSNVIKNINDITEWSEGKATYGT